LTSFIVLAVLLGGVALALLTRPLWWRARHDPATADAHTLAEAREQLRQLDALRRSGALTDAQASEARTRLEQRVGEALAKAPVAPPVERRSTHLMSSLSLFVVVIAVAGYATLGTPQALDPAARSARADSSHAITMEQIQGMADKLAARLKDQPNDPEGWAMLGRSYAVLGDAQRALGAFKQAMALRPDDAVLLADYADTLALANDRNLEGEQSRLIARALEIDPNNLKALSLAGTAAFMRKDYALALRHWEKMAQVAPDSDWVKQIQGGIDEARRLAAASGTAPPATPSAAATKATTQAGGATVSGVVKLSTSLAGKAAPDDTLFVYARAAQGPRMPLAILRKQVKDLPLTFTLDDSMAMSPAAKLSSATQVTIGARISKSGTAIPQPGDLAGEATGIAPGATGVAVRIGSVVGKP
jgi:cytochrome c-type biogenesis protein CcmH